MRQGHKTNPVEKSCCTMKSFSLKFTNMALFWRCNQFPTNSVNSVVFFFFFFFCVCFFFFVFRGVATNWIGAIPPPSVLECGRTYASLMYYFPPNYIRIQCITRQEHLFIDICMFIWELMVNIPSHNQTILKSKKKRSIWAIRQYHGVTDIILSLFYLDKILFQNKDPKTLFLCVGLFFQATWP